MSAERSGSTYKRADSTRVHAHECLLALLVFAAGASAQVDQGQIAGTVTDSVAAVVPTAKVTTVHDQSGVAHATESGPNGSYFFTNLPVGYYTVAVEKTGFKKAQRTNVK